MNLPYTMRLLCLCWASFFMLHLALALMVRMGAGTAVRVAEHMKPRSAARLLFLLRTSPWVLTLLAVLAFCIPSYLWLEPEATGEKVGLICMMLALAGVAICVSALSGFMEPFVARFVTFTIASITGARSWCAARLRRRCC